MVIVQLSLIGEADGYGLLQTNNTPGSGAECSFGPSIWQKVVEVAVTSSLLLPRLKLLNRSSKTSGSIGTLMVVHQM